MLKNKSVAALGFAVASSAMLGACGGSDNPPAAAVAAGGQSNNSSGSNSSLNWAGYIKSAAAGTFNQVGASWTVPAVDCSGSAATASATWTGIGGASSADSTLIQAGTEQDCNGGSVYYAWWEAFPAPSVNTAGPLSAQSYPVKPGDRITVGIDATAGLVWNISIHNATAGWTFTTTTPFGGATASAEWIEETPLQAGTSGAGQMPLSKFGSVGFSGLAANGTSPALTAGERVALTDAHGNVLASPSDPKSGGSAFDVCYGSGACP